MAKSILHTAKRILSVQKYLHPMLFDINGIMYEDIRQKILKIADFFIQKNIAFIDGLEVTDILLAGSTARYIYHKNSDIDVKILIKNSSNPILKKSVSALNDFIGLAACSFMGVRILPLRLNNIRIDLKFDAEFDDFIGHYSILNNKWIVAPKPKFTTQITLNDLMKNYFNTLADKYKFMQSIKIKNNKVSLHFLDKFEQFYMDKVIENNNTPLKYLTYKLLSAQGEIRNTQIEYLELLKDTLSLGDNPTNGAKPLMMTVRRILRQKKTINPAVFDEHNIMKEPIRKHILKIINFIIKKELFPINCVEIDDILLIGSSTSNMYYEKSDFDIIVTCKIKDNHILTDDKYTYFFISKLLKNSIYYADGLYKIGSIAIDLIFKQCYGKDPKSYSVLHNHWIEQPCIYQYEKYVSAEKLLKTYYKKMEEIYRILAKIQIIKHDRETAKKILDLYNSVIITDINIDENKPKQMLQYLAYKLISSKRIPGFIKSLSSQALNSSLSLEKDNV